MKEYRIAKGWAIFIYITAPFMLALFGWVFFSTLMSARFEIKEVLFLAPISLGMLFLITVGVMDTIKGKVIFGNQSIAIKSTFINRTLKFEEIKGYRVINNYLFILPNTKAKKRIKISLYIAESDHLIENLSNHFVDLDLENEKRETEEILANINCGQNPKERARKLSKAKVTAKILNISGGIIMFSLMLLPSERETLSLISIVLPIITIFSIFYFSGLIRIDNYPGGAYASVFLAFLFPTIGLCLRAFFDFNIYDFSKLWKFTAIIGIPLFLITVLGTKEFKFKKVIDYFTFTLIGTIFLAYGLSTSILINCIYDKTEPNVFHVKVVNKQKQEFEERVEFHLEIEPWHTKVEKSELEVHQELFTLIQKGEYLEIELRNGYLNIPYFYVKNKILRKQTLK